LLRSIIFSRAKFDVVQPTLFRKFDQWAGCNRPDVADLVGFGRNRRSRGKGIATTTARQPSVAGQQPRHTVLPSFRQRSVQF